MFRQQSGPWKSIATVYVERIVNAIRSFNDAILQEKIADDDSRQKLAAKLSQRHEVAHEEAKQTLLTMLNDERQGILQTVNHYFADTLSSIRERRVLARLEAAGFQDGSIIDFTATDAKRSS
jgi:hypothetical protein